MRSSGISRETRARAAAVLSCALAFFSALAAAWAQDYPSRPIRIIVPVPPAQAPDVVARTLAPRLTERLGKGVVVENRVGANGTIGAEAVVRAAPDGYTLLLTGDSHITLNPHVYTRLTFSTLTDLAPVTAIAGNRFFLAVTPSLKATTLQELIELARRSDPPLQYGSPGEGSPHQLGMELLKRRAGMAFQHIPYKGGAAASTALVGGHVAAMFSGAGIMPLIRAGKLRGIAVTSKTRAPEFPELPAIGELYPGFELHAWHALFAPAGTPEPVKALLRREVVAIMQEPDVVKRLADGGGLQPYMPAPDAFATVIRVEYDRYGELVRAVGITLE